MPMLITKKYICDFILNCWILGVLLISGLQAVPKFLPLVGNRILSRLSIYWARYLSLVPSALSLQGGIERTLVTGLGNMIFLLHD